MIIIGKCAAKLASACKKCIRVCNNIKSVALSAADAKKPELGQTTFKSCYTTFGCANDCDASLKKVKGTITQKRGGKELLAVGDLTLEEQIEWAFEFPFETMKEARHKGYFYRGVLDLEKGELQKSSFERPMSDKEFKNKGWWWEMRGQ